ncbi:TPT-domain-containing protein [Wolfiporia cocos MD-104 SS10]|uniref:TPT-domain-containing protein n=1 Tax=Wolfiporia cocos (strain MD-104) TaxID=742152 RepID=A0A2H3JQJ2_WOLCO|nr:TPT-domain-containing protein [Wolfiporia cocos MD-104 SS10]
MHNPAVRLRNIKRAFLRRISSWSQGAGGRPRPTLTASSPQSPLPAPATVRFVLLCALWYTTSALSSNTGKVIMTQFRYPITLTFVQFGFVAAYCLLFMSPLVRFSRFRAPTKAILESTLPMGVFQVGGHIFSSMAISRIPVSTVHTIKALSPLFTVAAYALLFRVRYSPKTYVSLLPLTLGVMLACSFDMSASNAIGLLCAFGSAIVFVSSNIFFKKIMPSGPGASAASAHKLDKLNLLFYSSGMAFVLMIPIWAYYDLPALLAMARDPAYTGHPAHAAGRAPGAHGVLAHFLANGTVHFAQNIIAFVLLAQTSPVTYSIASLVKRVAVICIAIAWFAQPVHAVQAAGIALTSAGLWLYNRAKGDVEKGERTMRRANAARSLELPSNRTEITPVPTPVPSPPPAVVIDVGTTSAYGRPYAFPPAASPIAAPPPPPKPHALPAPPAPARSAHAPHQTHRGHPLSYSQTHNAPNLRIQITAPPPSNVKPGLTPSPVDLYPSPPPSLDSPPLEERPEWAADHRGATAVGCVPERPHEAAPRAVVAA